jgi:hypothetical protein
MAETREFQQWARLHGLKKIGWMDQVYKEIDRSMEKIKIEVKNNLGRWVEIEL